MEKRARYTSSRSQSCINVALRFVSPENVGECIRLTEERRKLPQGHVAKDDKLEVKKMVLHAMMEAIIDLGAIRRNNSKMDSVKSLSSTSSSTPVNKVGDAMPQATQQRSLDIVRQSEDMAQARRKSSAIENELAMPQATPPTSLDIVGQSEDMPLGRMKIFSAIENEMVRTPQADCRSPVSSHLFSTTRAMLQATSSTFSDTVGQSEDMAPAGRKICSAIEDELVRTAQADCRSLVSSRHLSAEKAMPQLTLSTSSDTVRQSEDMAPAGRKICSSIEDELVRTAQVDCRSPISSHLFLQKRPSHKQLHQYPRMLSDSQRTWPSQKENIFCYKK